MNCTELYEYGQTVLERFNECDYPYQCGMREFCKAIETLTEAPAYFAANRWYYGPQTKASMLKLLTQAKKAGLNGLDEFASRYGYKPNSGDLKEFAKAIKAITKIAKSLI